MPRKQFSIAQRAQALTLLESKSISDVMQRTGMGRQTLYDLKHKAVERGYKPDLGIILDEHVVDAPRSGRPKAAGEDSGAIKSNIEEPRTQEEHNLDGNKPAATLPSLDWSQEMCKYALNSKPVESK